jgi:hypothetical protein
MRMVTRSPAISAHGVRERFDCQLRSLEGLRQDRRPLHWLFYRAGLLVIPVAGAPTQRGSASFSCCLQIRMQLEFPLYSKTACCTPRSPFKPVYGPQDWRSDGVLSAIA